MSDPDMNAILQGKHTVLHPVQLPDILPSTIVEKMMERFRNYLRCELEFWMKPSNIPPSDSKTTLPRKKHRRVTSTANESAQSSNSRRKSFGKHTISAAEWTVDEPLPVLISASVPCLNYLGE